MSHNKIDNFDQMITSALRDVSHVSAPKYLPPQRQAPLSILDYLRMGLGVNTLVPLAFLLLVVFGLTRGGLTTEVDVYAMELETGAITEELAQIDNESEEESLSTELEMAEIEMRLDIDANPRDNS
jgi:hypothetical protein